MGFNSLEIYLKSIKKNKDLGIIYENLKIIINRYWINNVIPDEITTSRLFCLNKKVDKIGDINNIRSITISCIFLKLNKSAILTRSINEINEKKILCNKQIGFIRGCETELNLQKVYDIKKESNFYIK